MARTRLEVSTSSTARACRVRVVLPRQAQDSSSVSCLKRLGTMLSTSTIAMSRSSTLQLNISNIPSGRRSFRTAVFASLLAFTLRRRLLLTHSGKSTTTRCRGTRKMDRASSRGRQISAGHSQTTTADMVTEPFSLNHTYH